MRPDLSVIVPTRNRRVWLEEAIASCYRGNDDLRLEVIVVDDGSDDGTLEWLETEPFEGLRVLRQSRAGACHARNSGLVAASADFVKFLDDDDWLAEGILSRQLNAIAAFGGRAEAVSLFGDVEFVSSQGSRFVSCGEIGPDFEGTIMGLFHRSPCTMAPLHSRRALLAIGGFDVSLSRAQEYDLHLRLGLSGVRFVYSKMLVGYVREHGGPRISNEERGRRHIAEAMRILDGTGRSLAERFGGKFPYALARSLALQNWQIGRQAARLGMTGDAQLCFERAQVLNSKDFIDGGRAYRLLVGCVGGVSAERLISGTRKWLRRPGGGDRP